MENDSCIFLLQPQVELKTRKIIGAEALARWQLADGTMIAPSEFLHMLDSENAVPALDWHICNQVAVYLKSEKKLKRKTVPISINLSRKNVANRCFSERVHKMFRSFEITPDEIVFELTEDVALDNVFEAKRMLRDLKSRGYRLSLDDFGTGFSSLETLLIFDMDEIKLDKSLLGESPHLRSRAMAIVTSIIDMAAKLGMTVLCEGVENGEQIKRLTDAGCDAAQGYYFSKPLMPCEFSSLLEKNNGLFPLTLS